MFNVMKPCDGEPASVGNGCMVALAASNPEQVQALYDKALALGAVKMRVRRASAMATFMAPISAIWMATSWRSFVS